MTHNIINFSDIVKAKNDEKFEEDLEDFWNDIINETYEFQNGQNKSTDIRPGQLVNLMN